MPGVVRPAGGADQDTIVLRDDGGRVLADVIAAAPLPIAEVNALALELARIIGAVHARGVVHKDINPSNVLLTGAGPVLIDFDLATTVAVDRPGFLSRRELAGTLPYVPPEQTGRTGLPIDHRADLYALGATLYELVSGHPPVSGGDDLRMIHDILLRVPDPLALLRPDVPPALSDIVDRLLRKEPDRRYQSAEGVARDLARVAARPAEGFALGEWDFPARLSAPSRLIGRDAERQALCAALEDALAGGPRGLLVAGVPGVGKSALINELRQPVAVRHGWFVSGKAEQYHPHAAVGATLQAVRGTGRLLLAEPSDVLAATRRHLAGALHTGLAAVTALLPEFAVLLGAAAETGGQAGAEAGDHEEPGEDTGDPATADARLRSAVVELLRVVVSPSRPLVLVVDDLQWADPVSLHLFDALLTEPDLPGLLVVGAYRAEEVDAGHPLTPMLARWQRLGSARPPLLLENLPAPESVRFVAELLRLTADAAAELDEELHRRTGGNPYDTLELVNALRRDGVLVLGEDGWSWDRAAVRSHVGHGDLLPVVRARIERLPAESVRLVCTMACLGGEIGVGLLARALDVPVATVRERLAPALEDGLLVPAGPAGAGDEADAGVRFRHDRVHQAAFTALGDAERTALRLTLARRLAGVSAVAAAEQYLAAGELDDDAERRTAARLYRTAAAYAERAGNYPVAERFLTAAVGLLTATGSGSAEDPELQAVRVRQHAARYALGRLDEADEVYAAIEATATDPLLLAAVADVQLNSLAQRGRQAEALPLGLRLLARLGRPAPPEELAADLPGRAGSWSSSPSRWTSTRTWPGRRAPTPGSSRARACTAGCCRSRR
ncbi:ATP-binding protein [Pseudosporangium ferrugineum]|uniref:ATP-binding protein n=1 Tax=Pseudosporangium ferrugineum TaxID=439699 RepID=UPI000D082DD8|nr:serine/threonine-protein kinase [Pseudosporangium ferrugineum]